MGPVGSCDEGSESRDTSRDDGGHATPTTSMTAHSGKKKTNLAAVVVASLVEERVLLLLYFNLLQHRQLRWQGAKAARASTLAISATRATPNGLLVGRYTVISPNVYVAHILIHLHLFTDGTILKHFPQEKNVPFCVSTGISLSLFNSVDHNRRPWKLTQPKEKKAIHDMQNHRCHICFNVLRFKPLLLSSSSHLPARRIPMLSRTLKISVWCVIIICSLLIVMRML